MGQRLKKLEQEAVEYGIDLGQLERALQMTPDERLRAHEQAWEMAMALRKGMEQYRARNGKSATKVR